ASDDDTPGERVAVAGARHFGLNHLKGFGKARLDDLRDDALIDPLPFVATVCRDGDDLALVGPRRRGAVSDLQLFGDRERRTQSDREVIADLVPANRQDERVYQAAVSEHGRVRRAATNVDDHAPEVPLGFGEHGAACGQWLEDQRVQVDVNGFDAPDKVVDRRHRARHDVCLDLETAANHAHRVTDPIHAIYNEVARNHVEDLLIRWKLDDPRAVDHARHVFGRYDAVGVADSNDSVAVGREHVCSRDPHESAHRLEAGLLFGAPQRGLDSGDRGLHVDDHPFAQSL